MNVSVKKTNDGSATLYNAALNEHYHSIHGALTESLYVFIQNGFVPALTLHPQPIKILEIGFGTGLNAALTAAAAETANGTVIYTALEPFPVSNELLSKLGYDTVLNAQQFSLFNAIHEAAWEAQVTVQPYFTLEKRQQGILDFNPDSKFHLIYFDAFAPEKQPDMWELPVLQKCFDLLESGGIFITYCAKGQFKRNMKACGFSVQAKPGPPFKREITYAVKG